MTGEEPAMVDQAIERGTRRRRRVWLASGVSACVLAGVGLAFVATRGESDAVVGDTVAPVATTSPASVPDTTAAHVTSTSTMAPSTSTSSTTSTTSSSTSSVPITTEVVAPPPTEPVMECPPDANIALSDVHFVVDSEAPAAGQGFLTQRADEYGRTSTLELWSESGRAATLDESVADLDYLYSCPTRLLPLGYDGRWIWVWTGNPSFCPECSFPRSQLIRADTTTGELSVLWVSDTGERVFDLVPDAAGGATIVTGPSPGHMSVDVLVVGSDGALHVQSSWPASTLQALSAALQVSTGRVAYTSGHPAPGGSAPELHVLEPGSPADRVFPANWSVTPAARAWAPVGDRLLVEDTWETVHMAVIDVGTLTATHDVGNIGDAACWMADGTLAAGTWDTGYVENDWSTGTVEVVDADDHVVADYGLDVLAGDMACLDDGRVAFTRYVNDFGTIVPDTIVVTIAGPDGSTIDVTQQPLWVIRADAMM